MEQLAKHIAILTTYKCEANAEFEHVDELIYNKNLHDTDLYPDFFELGKLSDKWVRFQFIKLIAESKKSTLGFTDTELEMINDFLYHNICEKMEFVPLIKKIIKRINENYLALQRRAKVLDKTLEYEKINHSTPEYLAGFVEKYNIEMSTISSQLSKYNKFCKNLLKFLASSIRLSAVFFQNQSSLQIITHMQDIMSVEICKQLVDDVQSAVYNCMLQNSYESNKELCFNILVKCNKEYLKGKVYETINVALQLANSMRPIDTITGSYLLKLAMLSSDFMEGMKRFEIIKSNTGIFESRAKGALATVIVLMETLEEHLKIADSSIVLAAGRHSLYGLLFCIRHVLKTVDLKTLSGEDEWRNVIRTLIGMGFRLSNAASEIVNNSSPEGHLPMDLDTQHVQDLLSDDNEVEVTPQLLLLCSWRSVKEVSLLFGEITSNAPILSEKTKGLISETEIKEIGEHFVKLLCETKHRGAFEQAHIGFGMLCSRLRRVPEGDTKEMPKIWLRRLIVEVSGLTHSNTKLCATRRSAGIPFMVQAIILSEVYRKKDHGNLILLSVMDIFIKLSQLKESESLNEQVKDIIFATPLFENVKLENFQNTHGIEPNDLTEIKCHALNILRTLVKNYRMGEYVQDYIADTLISAVRSYDGNSWAERNAATLLLAALVTRIFGVQRTKDHVKLTHHNRLTGSKFFDKYPKLLEFMIQELQHFTADNCMSIKPGVQSILLILSRLCPSHVLENSDLDWRMNDFIELTSHCGKSRVYKTRELAARALVQFLTEKNLNQVLSKLISAILTNLSSFNAAHGYSLQIIEVIKTDMFAKCELLVEDFIELFNCINNSILLHLETSSDKPACFPLASACISIFHTLLQEENLSKMEKLKNSDCKSHTLEIIRRHLTENCLKDRPGRQIYEEVIAHFYVAQSADLLPVDFWQNIVSKGNDNLNQSCFQLLFYPTAPVQDNAVRYSYDSFVNYIMYNMNLEDPQLRYVCYRFLRKVVTESRKDLISPDYDLVYDIMKWALTKKDENLHNCEGFFSLLEGTFVKLSRSKNSRNYIPTETLEDLYTLLVDNSWMGNSGMECRLEIAKSISAFEVEMSLEIAGLVLSWWTAILHLLLDDDDQVRSVMAKLVCDMEPRLDDSKRNTELCSKAALSVFFNKFASRVCRSHPYIATVMLFSWGTNLVQDDDFEMDESDVFTKSHNYNFLDFEHLADLCIDCIKNECKYEKEDGVVNYRKMHEKYAPEMQPPFRSFDELFYHYENHPVITTDDISHLLDPNYHKKLLRSKIYYKFRSL